MLHRLRHLVGALPAAVYTCDAEGRITEYNEAAAALCACSADVTGMRAVSLDLIRDWGLEVHNLDGTPR